MHEDVSRAREWAIEQHGEQRYGKGDDARPYAYHLGAVAAIAAPYGEEAEVVAWLHDVIEDTGRCEADVAGAFGARVAHLVMLLTDEPGFDRAEKKRRSHAKLAGVDGADSVALIVKAADRLANLRESAKPGPQNEKKLAKYRGEHPAFRRAAYRPGLCDSLWAEIDSIIGPLGDS